MQENRRLILFDCPKITLSARRVLLALEKRATRQAMKRALPLLFCLGLQFLSTTALADEPEPLHRFEDKSHPSSATRRNLFLAGAGVTALFYLPVLGSSYLWSEHEGASSMRIPIAGPWIALGHTSLCGSKSRDPSAECSDFMQVAGAVLLVIDGLGQAGGLAMMIESVFMPTAPVGDGNESVALNTSPFRLSNTRSEHASHQFLSIQSGDFRMRAVPMVQGNSDLGLALVGHF